jgi:glucose/arabinose dehydrogenase/thiol-disulfide isomerase/thioredoxin
MRPCRLALVVCCLVWFASAPASELPDGFRLEPVLGGLTNPSAMAMAPHGEILIAERTTGNLRLVRGGELEATPACTVSVDATGEGGLLGVAMHPRYPGTPFVYLYYTDLASGVNRVVRYSMVGGVCTSPTVIVSDLGSGANGLRNGGGMTFGADGKLYIATGDVEDPGNGQDPGVDEGKVLRLEDDGTIPLDNPTPGSAVFAVGVRDGRGLTASGSRIYLGDHGDDPTDVHDEIHAVSAGDDLGWAVESGPGSTDEPLASWEPPLGLHGVALYAAGRYPELAADGLDSDHDSLGPDRHPGRARIDDNTSGVCVGSANSGAACTSGANCTPRPGGEPSYCELRDDLAEYCPGGSAIHDDVCGATTGAGVDEPDEGYAGSVFAGSTLGIRRAVPKPGLPDEAASWNTFLDASGAGTLPDDCPTGWTGVAVGHDGHVYALATNGGGANGRLYRIVHEGAPGPREVSPPGTPFPLRVRRVSPTQVELTWEDLRNDARQPRDDGTNPLAPERVYTVWRGTMGSYGSHTQLAGFSSITGTAVNDALRRTTVPVTSTASQYFLVSGVGSNIRGTLGNDSDGNPRPGITISDLCAQIGFHTAPSWPLFRCGQDMTLVDEHNEPVTLSDYRGRVVMLDFSAIWCAPCHAEADALETLYQAYRERGVVILTVLMDEAALGPNWDGRPTFQECVNWGDRTDPGIDHTFSCLADPVNCTGDPCGAGATQEGWPKYDAHNALPTNVVLDHGHRVVYTGAGYNPSAIAARFNALVGTTDSCLH